MADTENRVACGQSGKNDYRSFFGVLKEAGYDGLIAMESFTFTDIDGARTGDPRVSATRVDAGVIRIAQSSRRHKEHKEKLFLVSANFVSL